MKTINTTNTIKAAYDRRRILRGIAGGVAAAGATTLFAPAVRAAKPIKIGYVSPKTGPLAAFGEADDFVLGEFSEALKDGVKIGAQTYQVEIVIKDSQSNPNRAAEVAAELIIRDNVDLIVVGATPETTNPVSDQCELDDVPCISTVAPWQPVLRPAGRSRRPQELEAFKWTYPLFLGPRGRHRGLHQHLGPGRDQQEGRRAVPQ